MSRPRKVYWILGIGLLSISVSPILIRYAGDSDPLSVAAWRSIFAVLFLLPVVGRRAIPEIRKMDRTGLMLTAVAGIFLGGHFMVWIESLYYTSVASASTLVSASPIFLAILGYVLLRERVRFATVIAIVIAVVGVVIVGIGDSNMDKFAKLSNPLLGNGMAFFAALLVSLYLIIGRAVRARLGWSAYVLLMYSVVMIVIVGVAFIGRVPLLGLPLKTYALCAAMGLIPQIVGHGSFNYSLKYFDASFLGLLSLFEPVIGSLLAIVLFSEIPGLVSTTGLIIVLAGLVLGILAQRAVKRD